MSAAYHDASSSTIAVVCCTGQLFGYMRATTRSLSQILKRHSATLACRRKARLGKVCAWGLGGRGELTDAKSTSDEKRPSKTLGLPPSCRLEVIPPRWRCQKKTRDQVLQSTGITSTEPLTTGDCPLCYAALHASLNECRWPPTTDVHIPGLGNRHPVIRWTN